MDTQLSCRCKNTHGAQWVETCQKDGMSVRSAICNTSCTAASSECCYNSMLSVNMNTWLVVRIASKKESNVTPLNTQSIKHSQSPTTLSPHSQNIKHKHKPTWHVEMHRRDVRCHTPSITPKGYMPSNPPSRTTSLLPHKAAPCQDNSIQPQGVKPHTRTHTHTRAHTKTQETQRRAHSTNTSNSRCCRMCCVLHQATHCALTTICPAHT